MLRVEHFLQHLRIARGSEFLTLKNLQNDFIKLVLQSELTYKKYFLTYVT